MEIKMTRSYILQQPKTGRHEQIQIPAEQRMDKNMLKYIYFRMRSDMEEKESEYEDAFLICPKGVKYYFCMERENKGGRFGNYTEVWACNTKDMQTRAISGEKHIYLISEVIDPELLGRS